MVADFLPFRFKVVAAASLQRIAQNLVAMVRKVSNFVNVHINLVFKTVQSDEHTAFADFPAAAYIPQAGSVFAEKTVFVISCSKSKTFSDGF